MIVIPSPTPEAKLSPSPTTDMTIMTRRSSSRSSRMATLKFTDSDSEDEQSKQLKYGHTFGDKCLGHCH